MDQDAPPLAPARVIVGTDGSMSALRAVTWAATEARLRDTGLQIVHAAPYADSPAARRHADGILGRARTVARRDVPGVPVRTRVLDASPARALAGVADDAELLVVGMISEHAADVLIGSVATTVAATAPCAVAVVRGHRQANSASRPVLLAVADPVTDRSAIDVAFADAERHGTGLIVVHATSDHAAAAHLERSLEPWRDRHPGTPVEIRTDHGSVISVLLGATARARLVVTGRHSHGAVARAVLGSTSRDLVRLSPCPVLVVPRLVAAPSPATSPASISEAEGAR
ncbi:universal stress protein [Pseudonocardia sp. CA-107938]|uniref:universal stress protein n=1 Tax=Pseudonocardia sp. CA-107938 TaxID=3240021 RepID=UPI003D913C48